MVGLQQTMIVADNGVSAATDNNIGYCHVQVPLLLSTHIFDPVGHFLRLAC